MIRIYSSLFLSLNRDRKRNHHYIVLNDGNYVGEYWADSDREAIEMFEKGEY